MFEEELLNNVMERYNVEFDEKLYRKISRIFMEEHVKLLRKQEVQVKSQIDSVSKMLKSLENG